jgi:hypothetical protein
MWTHTHTSCRRRGVPLVPTQQGTDDECTVHTHTHVHNVRSLEHGRRNTAAKFTIIAQNNVCARLRAYSQGRAAHFVTNTVVQNACIKTGITRVRV